MLLRRLAPVVLLTLGLAAFVALDLGRYFAFATLQGHHAELQGWIDIHPVGASLGFILLYTAAVAFSLPIATFLTVVSGIFFGAYLGMLWALLGATLGAALVFLAARSALGNALRARAGPRLARLQRSLQRDGFHYLLFLRLVPLFPFWLVNIAPAFFGMRLGTYLLATVIGILPGTFVFSYFGHGLATTLERAGATTLRDALSSEILLALTLLALLSLLPIWLKRSRFAGDKADSDEQ